MIEVRIEHRDGTHTGRCSFCWGRMNAPERVQAFVYEDGEPFGGLACPDCLALDDAALRATMRGTAVNLEEMAEELRASAGGVIRRPEAGVLELERLAALPSPVVMGPITPPSS